MNLGATRYSREELKKAGFLKVGKNVLISKRASLYGVENISIGDNVRIDDFATLIASNNKLVIGNYVTIHNYCFIGARAGVFLDNFVTLAPSVKIFSASDDYSGEYLTGSVVPAGYTGGNEGAVYIREHCIIGASSIILPNLTITEGTSVGALSLIKDNTLPWSVYAGRPAKKINERKKELLNFASAVMGGKNNE